MVYLTGDTHGDFERIDSFITRNNCGKDDIIVILGDAGINYSGGRLDLLKKRWLADCSVTFLCIHGNHEMRPESIQNTDGSPMYKETEFRGGIVYVEPDYPNILFAKDGEVYDLPDADGQIKRCVAIGGAYSVDMFYRLKMQMQYGPDCGYNWFPDEQPSEAIKERVEAKLTSCGNKIDVVFSHTCPYKYIPRETFLPGINQETVDSSTEKWLDRIEDVLTYGMWFCGHYHISKVVNNLRFMFEDYCAL